MNPLPDVLRVVSRAEVERLRLATSFSRDLIGKTTCSRGCAHCCHHPVFVSLLEGISVYLHAKKRLMWTHSLQKSLKEHAKKTFGLAPSMWVLSMTPCPFLDLKSRECSIYQGRPFDCRTTWSLGFPEACHPHRLGVETRLVPRYDIQKKRVERETAVAEKTRTHILVPLSLGVLAGRAIVESGLPLGDVAYPLLLELIDG